MLARREHSDKELQQKLITRGFDADAVSRVLTQLKQEGLQSNHRFTDAFVHNRIQRGYGPLRISRELQQRGVAENLIEEFLINNNVDWIKHLGAVRNKKFGKALPANYKEQARQSRFLQYRGFSGEQIRHLFQASDE